MLAAGQPTPGGGGAAALTGSQAAALVSMVINFTVGRKKYEAVEEEMKGYLAQSEALRQELLRLVEDDAAAFDGVAATYSMPKETPEEKAARTDAMQSALKAATQVPFTVAEKCLQVLRLAAPVGAKGNANVVSDAATAALPGLWRPAQRRRQRQYQPEIHQGRGVRRRLVAPADDLQNAATLALEAALAACAKTLGVDL